MSEFHDRLEEEARRVSAGPKAFDEVKRRAGRRRIRRQVTTGVLALAIAGGSFALAFAAFRGTGTSRPAAGPSPSATSPVRVRLLDGADDPEAMEVARELLSTRRFRVLQEGDAGHRYERTTIACLSEDDDEAARAARQLGVDAAIVLTSGPNPGYDLTVYIGEDFATFEHELLRGWIRDFIEARREGDAERFLAPTAYDDYFETSGRSEPRPGELYLYPEQGIGDFGINGFDKLDSDTWRFELRLRWRGCGDVGEEIWIEVLGENRYELSSAELIGNLYRECSY